MSQTVPVTIDVDSDVAAALEDPVVRARLDRLIRRTLKPTSIKALFAAMDALSDDARQRGLTEEMLRMEIAAHNAEHRERPATG